MEEWIHHAIGLAKVEASQMVMAEAWIITIMHSSYVFGIAKINSEYEWSTTRISLLVVW